MAGCPDLEDIPCLLVLVEKGRMGDTFPFSMDCMDLRARGVTSAGVSALVVRGDDETFASDFVDFF